MCHHSHNIKENCEKEREFVPNIIWHTAPSASVWYAFQTRPKYRDIILNDNSHHYLREPFRVIQQAAQFSPLFQFALRGCAHVLVHCTAFNIRGFSPHLKSAGNIFFRLWEGHTQEKLVHFWQVTWADKETAVT